MLDCDRDIALTDTRRRPMGPRPGSPIAVDALVRCVAGSSDSAAHAIAA
jgi:hypothetical protein